MKIAFFSLPKDNQAFFENSLSPHEVFCFEEKLNNFDLNKIKEIDIISVFVDSIVDKDVIDNLPNLKFVATRSTGYDHIDYKYAESKDIKVSNVPVYGSHTVAEYTFALILNLSRKIIEAKNQLKELGNFQVTKETEGFDLYGKNIGIIGTGKIGKNVINLAQAFNMNILAYDPYPDVSFAKEKNFEYKNLDDVLSNADIITLHAPYTKENYHIINKDNISKMKKGVYIINTARGELLDTDAVFQGLKDGVIGGVGLDVIEGERSFQKDKLNNFTNMPNALLTPHIAFHSREAVFRIEQTTIDNIKGFISDNLQNIVK